MTNHGRNNTSLFFFFYQLHTWTGDDHLPVCVSNLNTLSNPSSPPQAMNPWSLFQDMHFSFTLLGTAICNKNRSDASCFSRWSWGGHQPGDVEGWISSKKKPAQTCCGPRWQSQHLGDRGRRISCYLPAWATQQHPVSKREDERREKE